MGALYDTFERELAACHQRYAESPQDEMVVLCLLALEREELVAVGYREDIILPRLGSVNVSDEIRELIHHALLWAWKDEEMHTIYIRGTLLKVGNRRLRLQAFGRQVAGAVAGWASSVRQHVSWPAAPLSKTAATLITGAGSLFGKVPRGVFRNLVYGPFRKFCAFNVDAERTAWLCWGRMAELATQIESLPPHTVADFRRVQDDVVDELREGESVETLAQKIETAGEFFLPRRMRKHFAARNPLGSGGPVWVLEGSSLDQKLELFRRILDTSGLADRIRRQASESGKRVEELRVAVKPTFMLGYDRSDTSMITDPVLMDALAQYLQEMGCADIAMVEARNIYDQFFGGRTVGDVAGYFGMSSPHYRVVDGTEDQVPHSYARGFGQYSVTRSWKEADFRISFGKMRSHPIELAYLTVGNVEWMGGRCDEFIFAERQAQRETAIMMLLDAFPPQFAILDAYESAADGLVGVMGCPHPKRPLRFYAAADALALDIVAARHMKVRDTRKSSVLRAACHWFGNPAPLTQVIGTDAPLTDWKDPYHNEISTMLSLLAFPVYVMGSGRGSMFLPEMDENVFPMLRSETFWQRLGRRGMRSLVGLRRPK